MRYFAERLIGFGIARDCSHYNENFPSFETRLLRMGPLSLSGQLPQVPLHKSGTDNETYYRVVEYVVMCRVLLMKVMAEFSW